MNEVKKKNFMTNKLFGWTLLYIKKIDHHHHQSINYDRHVYCPSEAACRCIA